MHRFPVRVSAIRQETPTIKSFTLDYGSQDFRFFPGQWVDLYVKVEGKEAVGGYSMTSSPSRKGFFDLAIKQGTRHPVTRYMYERAQVGDEVLVSGGQGVFIFERGMADHVVLVGAGVGVTPLMSILHYVDEVAPEVHATLVYSIPSPDEFLFQDDLEAMAGQNERISVLATVTQSWTRAWTGRTGRIDRNLLREADESGRALYYLCGPQEMIEHTIAELNVLGVPDSRIVYEKWW